MANTNGGSRKETEIMKMVIAIGSPSEAWRAFSKSSGQVGRCRIRQNKKRFSDPGNRSKESVTEYFARVNIVLLKLERHTLITHARESSALY